MSGWIGVDLDGTLAYYGGWMGAGVIGEPIPAMVERIKRWLAEGKEVRIFTARVANPYPQHHPEWERRNGEVLEAMALIRDYTRAIFGVALEATCEKDFGMIELWDDRAVQVEPNTGRRMDGRDG